MYTSKRLIQAIIALLANADEQTLKVIYQFIFHYIK